MLLISDKMLRQASLLATRSLPAIRLTVPGLIESTIPGFHLYKFFVEILYLIYCNPCGVLQPLFNLTY